MVRNHPAKFCSEKHCGSNDIMVLICHMILQDQLTKGSCDFMGRRLFWLVAVLPSLVAIDIVVVEI